jgi:hypothetical protein
MDPMGIYVLFLHMDVYIYKVYLIPLVQSLWIEAQKGRHMLHMFNKNPLYNHPGDPNTATVWQSQGFEQTSLGECGGGRTSFA